MKFTQRMGVIAVFGLLSTQAVAVELTTLEQRFSYLVGMNIGQQLKADNIALDETAFMQAVQDAMSGTEFKLSQEEMQKVSEEFQQQRIKEAAEVGIKNKRDGEAFLSANRNKDGVKETESGLQYKVIAVGTGVQPAATDTVRVHYRGTLIDGTEFDSSYSRGEPTEFPVNGVIDGWQEALKMMKEGDKWEVYLPPSIAYGERGTGGPIGANATLIFEMELLKVLSVNTKPAPAAIKLDVKPETAKPEVKEAEVKETTE